LSARAGAARRKWTAATGSHTMSAMSKAATLSVMFEPRSGAGLSGSCVAHSAGPFSRESAVVVRRPTCRLSRKRRRQACELATFGGGEWDCACEGCVARGRCCRTAKRWVYRGARQKLILVYRHGDASSERPVWLTTHWRQLPPMTAPQSAPRMRPCDWMTSVTLPEHRRDVTRPSPYPNEARSTAPFAFRTNARVKR
jgi:hypothetical protein